MDKDKIKSLKDKKGFYAIKCPTRLLAKIIKRENYTCDDCCHQSDFLYFSVICNAWFCPSCYKHFMATSTKQPIDILTEMNNLIFWMRVLKKWK